MTCDDVMNRATDYMEQVLPVPERFVVSGHLAGCRRCRKFFREIGDTVSLLRELKNEPVPESTRQSLLTLFRSSAIPPSSASVAREEPRHISGLILSFLEQFTGGYASLFALALLVLCSFALVTVVRAVPAPELSHCAGLKCGAVELCAGLLPLAIVGAVTWRGRRRLSWAAYALPGGVGALLGQTSLHFTCPEQGLYFHLAFHVLGVLAALALGWGISVGQAVWTGPRIARKV